MSDLTPMMQQYLDVKERYPDSILFFRLGDFYEMFFEDAVVVTRNLDLQLTSRNKGDEEVPMAGMPYHSSKSYIRQLLDKGFSVAICEQIEDASQASGIVERDVVRVISPGVQLDEENLDDRAPNYLAAVVPGTGVSGARVGLSYLDITTGEFRATELSDLDELVAELERIEAQELLIPKQAEETFHDEAQRFDQLVFRPRPDHYFDVDRLQARVGEGVRLSDDLDGDGFYLGQPEVAEFFEQARDFGFLANHLVESAMAAVLSYLVDTQRGIAAVVQNLDAYEARNFLIIDESTKANLELTETLMGGRRAGSLLSIIDETKSALGGRRLRNWLNYPLIDADQISARHNAVEAIATRPALRQDIRKVLDEVYDVERLCGRVASGRANARDLRSLQSTLAIIPEAIDLLRDVSDVELLERLAHSLDPCTELCTHIDQALVEEPPAELTEGDLFQYGYNDDLDELIDLADSGKDWMIELEQKERQRTGISSLKVDHNKVFGYYIEVTKANLDRVPDEYIRKQTLTNSERYFIPELKEKEEQILGANEERKELEYQLFDELRHEVAHAIGRLLQTASAVADLDVMTGLAELAVRREYSRPTIDESTHLDIDAGRHPVVEDTLEDERFVPNSTTLDSDDDHLLIITGPNMAGKSTVIRQVALITLLAQMGSFVPANDAHVGIVDKIFSRVGASDNLAKGQSTFMVEMTEAAHILNNATEQSLIILDEIGRGTATFDGLSIAWAVAEYIHDHIGARTLFATHYHELTELDRSLDGLKNMSIAVKEWQDDIIFLRKLVDGRANHSYGIQVGRLAGLPDDVVERAKQILNNLESGQFDDMGLPAPASDPDGEPRSSESHNPNQISLFQTGGPSLDPAEQQALEQLKSIDVDTLSPIEALNTLHRLSDGLNTDS